MKKFLFACCFLSVGFVQAQSWNCDSVIVVYKTTDFISIHTYGAVHNLIAQDIDLRWEVTFYQIPAQWEIYLDDPSAPYGEVFSGDGRDFVLSGNVDPQYPEKMIYGMEHNNTTGHGYVDYKIFSVNNPSDSAHMVFDITINQGTNGITEAEQTPKLRVSHGILFLPEASETVNMYNLNGKLVWTAATQKERQIKLPGEIKGIVFLEVITAKGIIHEKLQWN